MRALAVVGLLAMCVSCAGWRGARVAPAPEPPQPEPEAPPEPPEYQVSEEVYSRTFDEIGDLICNLNQIIREEDFQTWVSYLSEEYIRTTSDPAYLKAQSEQPLLKKNRVELRSLEDYFYHVVVPSRSQAQLDKIEFLDENHVKAISIVRGTRVVLYLLTREQGNWKIGLW
jgi:hypothetical protein